MMRKMGEEFRGRETRTPSTFVHFVIGSISTVRLAARTILDPLLGVNTRSPATAAPVMISTGHLCLFASLFLCPTVMLTATSWHGGDVEGALESYCRARRNQMVFI